MHTLPASYAARLSVDYPAQLDRLTTFFRLIWILLGTYLGLFLPVIAVFLAVRLLPSLVSVSLPLTKSSTK